MKTFFTLFIALTLYSASTAQVVSSEKDSTQTDTTILDWFAKVESKATFIGGSDSMFRFINDHIVVPEGEGSGTIVVNFVIEIDGSVSKVEILPKSKSPNLAYNQACLDVVKRMSGHWNPAIYQGKPVRIRYSIPFKFG